MVVTFFETSKEQTDVGWNPVYADDFMYLFIFHTRKQFKYCKSMFFK